MALRLIQTGCSKQDQVDTYGMTALILACGKEMTDVALRLIQTGGSKPDQVNNDGDTALIWACKILSMNRLSFSLRIIEYLLNNFQNIS